MILDDRHKRLIRRERESGSGIGSFLGKGLLEGDPDKLGGLHDLASGDFH
jgi:hypothetical protein